MEGANPGSGEPGEWQTMEVANPGSREPWEWRTMGVVYPGSGGPWEWRAVTDRLTPPKKPSFLLSADCCSVSSSISISMRTLSLVFFSVHDILCIFLHINISR